MKRTMKLLSTMCLWLTVSAWMMANTTTTVEQVTGSVNLTNDVDYVINSTIPFTSSGSVNIANTDHAALIIKNIKPSVVINRWLKYVTIEGATAANDVNCQVKMYDRGTIIFPYYKDFQPLTCYTEQNFEGTACNNYTEGHSGGFMKTITAANLNNQIRSFKLKRGYMVTFAVGTGGWGYSRCFIADKADLEMSTLPAILDGRISSYRIFKWNYFSKLGLANDTRYESTQALNVTGCYSFGGGESRMPDTECVPHHIYEDWPSAAACGGVTYSCHMKTNNEPGNSADDHPQDVATVLANWQNLMRTGMRLCSESSHDGSWNHLRAFIDSIDARGWRCDILDLHCYWDSGFGNMSGYSNSYGGRPVWISEWIWGASWNRNGCFADGRTEQQIINRTTEILNALNSSAACERYFYWNSESKGHIYENGKLTELGKVYAAQETGLGYNTSEVNYIPKNTRIEKIGTLNGNYNRKTGVLPLTWSDPNGDIMDNISIQCKTPDSNFFNTIGSVTPKDKSSASGVSYLYNDTITEPGVYTYRIKAVAFNNKTYYSDEIQVQVAPAQGTDKYQFGRLSINDEEASTTYFSENFESTPSVFIGTMTNKNPTYYASNYTAKTVNRSSFTFQFQPWSTNKGTLKNNEELPFLALERGSFTFGSLQCEVGEVKSESSSTDLFSDVSEVTFETPFPEGVVPVVLTEIRNPVFTTTAFGVRVFDVTNTGFKFIVYTEDAKGVKVTLGKNVAYLAITPGVGTMDEENDIYIAAGFGIDSQIYGSSQRDVNFYLYPNAANDEKIPLYMLKPTVLTALQTNNFPALCMLRRTDITEADEEGTTWTTGTRVKRILDHDIVVDGTKISTTSATDATAAYRDNIGWVAISSVIQAGEIPTGINTVSQQSQTLRPMVENGKILVPGHTTFEVYSISGARVSKDSTLPSGIYIVRAGKQSAKVIVK